MKTILAYYKKYIPFMLIVLVMLFGQAICELMLPTYMADIIDKGIVAGDMSRIRSTGMIMIIIAFAAAVLSSTGNLFASITAAKTARNIRRDLFRKVTSFSAAEIEKFSTASLITRSTNDVQMIQQATVMALRMMIFAPMMGVGAVIMALKTSVSLSWTIGLALLCACCLMAFSFIAVLPKFRLMQEKLDRINLIMKERLTGTLVVRAFRTEKHEEERFDIANQDLTGLYIFVNKCLAFMMPTMTFIMSGVSILIVWAGAHLIDGGGLLVGDMMAYLQYAMHVIMSFMFVTMIFVMLPRAAVSCRRIGRVLDTEISIRDPEKEAESPNSGLLEFRDVAFAYPESDEMALEGISFTARPGEMTAIIGGTGSGKSTIVNLIARFYDVTRGAVFLDGIDIREMTQEELRSHMGLVPQKSYLFSGTIRSNLMYGNPEAEEAELLEAVQMAQAMEIINSRAAGLDEEVSQGGSNLSGGQKQRLCIARALVRKPDLMIFDDSFSALDFATDKALRKTLREKVSDCTFIIVAQRINTIIDADSIIVLDEGRIAGIGTHEELMRDCRIYKEIALSQLSEKELGKEV